MGSKSGLCLYCGRWTALKNPFDGLAECDWPECINKRLPTKDDPWFDDVESDC
jgi:hypothetical protein